MLPSYGDCQRMTIARNYSALVKELTGQVMRTLPKHIGAAVGTGVHKGAEYTLIQKMETEGIGRDQDATEIAVLKLREESEEGVQYDKVTTQMNSAEQQVIRMTRMYRLEVAPIVHPSAVERRLEADIGGGFYITGKFDGREISPDTFRDLKTGGIERVSLPQQGAYAVLGESNGYPDVQHLYQDHIPRVPLSRDQPKPSITSYPVDLAKRVAWHRIQTIKRDIQEFLKTAEPLVFEANPSSMLCSDRFCPAWGTKLCREHKGAL
jgi:hypothetical protein